MFRKFASIAHPEKYTYLYDSEAWDTVARVNMHMRMFDTHGRITPIGEEFAADYLTSLVAAMLAVRGFGDTELAEEVAWRFPTAPNAELIAFACSVKDNDMTGCAPRRYYSLEVRKITADPAKQNDKRYERIESGHDGSAEAVYRMLSKQHQRGLENFILADAIRRFLIGKPGYGSIAEPTEFLKWDCCTEAEAVSSQVRQAIDAIRSICEAHRLLRNTKHFLECHVNKV